MSTKLRLGGGSLKIHQLFDLIFVCGRNQKNASKSINFLDIPGCFIAGITFSLISGEQLRTGFFIELSICV